MFVKLLFAIDYIAALVLIYFFFEGLGDGSVSADNLGLWSTLLLVVFGAIGGAHLLYAHGKRGLSALLLAVPGTPAFLYGLFILLIVILQPDWR